MAPTNNGLSVEKALEKAEATGELTLPGRNLKAFPKHNRCKADLRDTVAADLSRNKLAELPSECTGFASLERLVLYHNLIRLIPESIVRLKFLRFLDLSRNQLSYLPASVCDLPLLQSLIVNNNRLVSLPEELAKLTGTLMQLDASCNEITHLPVQIGDLGALRVLELRRNHLQEVPVEISYLQLTTLDLSGNRIVTLPVELRFMTTITSLDLSENPLTCPPANLCSRGRIHVFKYLETQAIKEDRKRGVVNTDLDYRRSYRKTVQLNDFRFANGFSADARRKRNTADSGYGSEQPLDRRWSQEFNQFEDYKEQTDEARRIIMRAANINSNSSAASRAATAVPSSSASSSTASSSGYGSIPHPADRLSVAVPTGSSSSTSSNSTSNAGSLTSQPAAALQHTKPSHVNNGEVPNDMEKEERRKAAQRVLTKQGNPSTKARPARCLPTLKAHLTPASSFQPRQQTKNNNINNNNNNNSMLPTPMSSPTTMSATKPKFDEPRLKPRVNGEESSQVRLTASALARMQMQDKSSPVNSSPATSSPAISSPTATRSLYDVKAMQKEAVLSYVKAKQASPGRGVTGTGSQPDLGSHVNNNKALTNGSRASSTTSIPQPSPGSRSAYNNAIVNNNNNNNNNRFGTATRRDAEKSATSDVHINNLRQEIESRLRITMPEDVSLALADGVILCHIANHVRARSVPSIHVPSPAVPKLNTIKCRKNVESFLLACRKIGVREDLICSLSDILEPRRQGTVRVSISVSELLRFYHHKTH